MTRHYLFVCKANVSRSPWAAQWFSEYCQLNGIEAEVRSAGTNAFQVPDWYKKEIRRTVQVTRELVDWADRICVMDYRQSEELQNNYGVPAGKVVNLGVHDNFEPEFKDPEIATIDNFGKAGSDPEVLAVRSMTPEQVRRWLSDRIWPRFGETIFAKLLEGKLEDILRENGR